MKQILLFLWLCICVARADRQTFLLDQNFLFQPKQQCANINSAYPVSYDDVRCMGLTQVTSATSYDECAQACCENSITCQVFQWCESGGDCSPVNSCWIGAIGDNCSAEDGWQSRGMDMPAPASPPQPGDKCEYDFCQPSYDDSKWRNLALPHDFVVEGTFTQTADMAHGYLPGGIAWYRRHFDLDLSGSSDIASIWIDFEGIQTTSIVWLNGVVLGTHSSGYTPSRYYVNASQLLASDNVLAVRVDATKPDGWWYDGGGIYRHVWLNVITTTKNGPYIAPDGLYIPSNVTGPITWNDENRPIANAIVLPTVEVWSNSTSSTPQEFNLKVDIYDPSNTLFQTLTAGGIVVGGKPTIVSIDPVSIENAQLWHIKDPLETVETYAALYSMTVTLSVAGSTLVDTSSSTFGIRSVRWHADTGLYLNEKNIKIMGMANHQDFGGIGVAVPDHLQWHRVRMLQQFGVNGWRTAHNPPNPALLAATDQLGMVVWDENHRNGDDVSMVILLRRDRNHPSVIIWSLCNEILCDRPQNVTDALRLKGLAHRYDPVNTRVVSANYNTFVGPNTPLDLQGFDYNTFNYDKWHAEAPNIPSMSSETSSAYSDRDEYTNDPVKGIVSGYDVNWPSWGQTAEMAWGGIGMTDNQGIFTRPFIAGGWVWTGWDYKGEPTPYQWPNINSHFGVLDMAGFPKDRYYYYLAWLKADRSEGAFNSLHVFPHWNWNESSTDQTINVWAYSNADEVELFVNGKSLGRKSMPRYAHTEWDVAYEPGSITAVSYAKGSSMPISTATRTTTGAAKFIDLSIKDGVGENLIDECNDIAIVKVAIKDENGLIVPSASNLVTFSVNEEDGYTILGTANGDPSCHTPDHSPSRPAYHGLVTAVIGLGSQKHATDLKVTASVDGFDTVKLSIPVNQATDENRADWVYWCQQKYLN